MNATSQYQFTSGKPYPMGATFYNDGVNFCIYCDERAIAVELLLFKKAGDLEPEQIIQLDPLINRSFYFWHIFVQNLPEYTYYAYRVDGPYEPENGLLFDKEKILIDPYSKGNDHSLWNRETACKPGSNLHTSMRSCVIDMNNYDWEGDQPLNHRLNESIIYEVHVKGFTQSPSSNVQYPGTYSGLIEKIPYLQQLGITSVELLPVFEFDNSEMYYINDHEIVNYWGYSTISFFAPHVGYCSDSKHSNHIDEFRDMVKALHRAGIDVILDVAFNHTNEGDNRGLTFSFKGLANDTYYMLDPNNKSQYANYSGCGNTFNCNHPIATKLILDCLCYWVKEFHIDGFRFDEGTILTRGEDGAFLVHPPAVWGIELLEELADTKIIAEAWDAGGAYMVGSFPGNRWAEWNGVYRDDIRDFVRGKRGLLGRVAKRFSGSSDLYQKENELPSNSINFICIHDGFTLLDLVSYNDKHNESNGENNRDGVNDNRSWNCGEEGPTDNGKINSLRRQQMKNFATILMLSKGVPMFSAGDEVCRTQHGNNNAYCQDNAISWFDWQNIEKYAGMLRFWQLLIAFRKRHPRLFRNRFYDGEVNSRGLPDISWHGCQLDKPGWEDPEGAALSMTLGARENSEDLHIMFNMFEQELDFELPKVEGRDWYCTINTSLPTPFDILERNKEIAHIGDIYKVPGHCVVVLISKNSLS